MRIKEILTSLAVLSLIAAPAVGLAEDSDSESAKDIRQEYRNKVEEVREAFRLEKREINDKIKDTREEAREQMKTATSVEDRLKIRDDRRDEVQALREEKVAAHIRKIVAKLNAALERSARFIDRVETILETREDKGQPVTNAEEVKAKLAEAETLIAAAKPLADDLPNKVAEILSASSTPDQFSQVRNLVTVAVQAVKDVHAKIVEAVRLIKSN